MTPRIPAAATNAMVAALPPQLRDRLVTLLQPVYCERHDVLDRAGEVPRFAFFPVTAVASLVARLSSGQMLEVGLVGRDGCVGITLVDSAPQAYETVVQVSGAAWRIEGSLLRTEMARSPELTRAIHAGLQRISDGAMQIALCNMFHPVEQRCVRWLLTMGHLVGRDDIPLTHELLATMLGVRRSTVTLVLRDLHRRGYIVEQRGRIVLAYRDGLEAACCECCDARLRTVRLPATLVTS